MSFIRAKVNDNGRIVIPADFRKELGIEPGDEVIMRLENGEIHVTTVEEAVRRAQQLLRQFIPPGRMLSDELIAERRAEAARE